MQETLVVLTVEVPGETELGLTAHETTLLRKQQPHQTELKASKKDVSQRSQHFSDR